MDIKNPRDGQIAGASMGVDAVEANTVKPAVSPMEMLDLIDQATTITIDFETLRHLINAAQDSLPSHPKRALSLLTALSALNEAAEMRADALLEGIEALRDSVSGASSDADPAGPIFSIASRRNLSSDKFRGVAVELESDRDLTGDTLAQLDTFNGMPIADRELLSPRRARLLLVEDR